MKIINVLHIWNSRVGCCLLAGSAGIISIALVALTGWQLGQSMLEKAAVAAVGVVCVAVVHFLLAFSRSAPWWPSKLIAIALWLTCAAYVAYSHARFILIAQQQAGMQRAATVPAIDGFESATRPLSEIVADRSRVKSDLAIQREVKCVQACGWLRIRLAKLDARLEALDSEADTAKRGQVAEDRRDAIRDSLRDDPVTAPLASWLQIPSSRIGLMTGVVFAVVLEGVGCFCWYLGLASGITPTPPNATPPMTQTYVQSVTEPVMPTVTNSDITGTVYRDLRESPGDEVRIDELISASRSDELKLVVKSVREYLGCSQETATRLTKVAKAKVNAMSASIL